MTRPKSSGEVSPTSREEKDWEPPALRHERVRRASTAVASRFQSLGLETKEVQGLQHVAKTEGSQAVKFRNGDA